MTIRSSADLTTPKEARMLIGWTLEDFAIAYGRGLEVWNKQYEVSMQGAILCRRDWMLWLHDVKPTEMVLIHKSKEQWEKLGRSWTLELFHKLSWSRKDLL